MLTGAGAARVSTAIWQALPALLVKHPDGTIGVA